MADESQTPEPTDPPDPPRRPTAAERAQVKKVEKLAQMQEQVESGRMTVRQMTPEEKAAADEARANRPPPRKRSWGR